MRDDRLIDPCNGRRDIEDRVLRMIFDKAFEEDPLRILRGIRFATRFSLDLEEKTQAAMKKNVQLINSISAERILDELNKTLEQCERARSVSVLPLARVVSASGSTKLPPIISTGTI